MLLLAVDAGQQVRAVTVDHGLRPEAAAEAAHTGTAPAKGRHYRALFQQLRATADAAELDAG